MQSVELYSDNIDGIKTLTAYLGSPLERHCVGQLVTSLVHAPALWELLRSAWVALRRREPAHIHSLTQSHSLPLVLLADWLIHQHVPTCPEHHN